jgi:predicted house-cleaning noncanonical NTP pyrophosphatase (MazG superfamily)
MTNYPKLVRDLIPEEISRRGAVPEVRVTRPEEMLSWLLRKMREELEEFQSAPSSEELADMLEVLRALAKSTGVSFEEVMRRCDAKRTVKGAFDQGYIIYRVTEPPTT